MYSSDLQRGCSEWEGQQENEPRNSDPYKAFPGTTPHSSCCPASRPSHCG